MNHFWIATTVNRSAQPLKITENISFVTHQINIDLFSWNSEKLRWKVFRFLFYLNVNRYIRTHEIENLFIKWTIIASVYSNHVFHISIKKCDYTHVRPNEDINITKFTIHILTSNSLDRIAAVLGGVFEMIGFQVVSRMLRM